MAYYFRKSDPNEVRDLGDLYERWIDANNPKAVDWELQPLQPTPEHVWSNGQWILPVIIPEPQWHDFSMALMTNLGVNAMLGQVLQSAPGLFGGLTIGLKNASDGDDRAFISSWQAAHQLNLLPQSVVDDVLEAAAYHHLPAGFITALQLN